MSRAPVDAVTSGTLQESLLARIHERRDAARRRFARRRAKQLVAMRATREGRTARVEWETREYLAELIAEQITLEVQRVGRGAQALVARQRHAALRARPPEQFGAAQRRVEQHVGPEQPEPSRKPPKHAVRGKARRRPSIRFGIVAHCT